MKNTEDSIKIGFKYTGIDKRKSTAYSEIVPHFDDEATKSDELEQIGFQFNNFLSQCGYVRKNDYIFMESVNEDELKLLEHCLINYRKTQEIG